MSNEIDVALRAVKSSNYDESVFNTFFAEISVESVQQLINNTTDREFAKLVMKRFGDAITYPEHFGDVEVLARTGTWMNKRLKKSHLPLVVKIVQTGYMNGAPEWHNHSTDVRIEEAENGIELETGEVFTHFDENYNVYYNEDGECCRICV